MREHFDPDLDVIADEQDIAEFKRTVVCIGPDHHRILQVLFPKLAALQERGDSAAALRLIADIRRIIVSEEAPLH